MNWRRNPRAKPYKTSVSQPDKRRQDLANAALEEQRRLREEALNHMASATAEIPAFGTRNQDVSLYAGQDLRTRKPDGAADASHEAEKVHGKRKAAKEDLDEKETHEKANS
jgi:hypothetical protein